MSALDARVSVFDRADRPGGRKTDATLRDVIEAVRSGQFAEDVAAVRAEPDEGRRKALKLSRLPALVPSGLFARRDAGGLLKHSGVAVIDLDDAPDLDALRADVTARPYVAAGFVSPSGDGFKALVPFAVRDPKTGELRAPRSDAEHKVGWGAVAARFEECPVQPDPSGKDVARACYLSHDPDAYVNEAAERVVVDFPPADAPGRPAPAPRDASARGAHFDGPPERVRIEDALAFLGGAGRLAYPEWVKLIAATLDAVRGDVGDAAALLVHYVGEEVPGEYAAKLASPLGTVSAGSLFWLAEQAGWTPRPNARASAARSTPLLPADDLSRPLGVCLADVTPEAIRWAWPGWLARGKVHVFDGDPGVGKSTLLAYLSACVTAGVPWPDGSPVPEEARGGVVILTAEDDPATTIRPRMEAAGADVSLVRVIATIPTAPTAATPDGGERLPVFPFDVSLVLGECRRVGARLLVVDPVTAYLGETNSHRDSDVRGALAPLAAAAEEAGVAVVLVRHLNKGAGGSALYRGGGSIAFTGLARVVWLAGRDPDAQDRRALAVSKNNLAEFEPTLAYDLESAGEFGVGRAVWLGTSPLSANDLVRPVNPGPATPAQDEAADFIREALADGPRLARELYAEAEAAGISEKTIKRAKARLGVEAERRGGLGSGGAWYWLPPPDLSGPRLEADPLSAPSGDGQSVNPVLFADPPKGGTPRPTSPPVTPLATPSERGPLSVDGVDPWNTEPADGADPF